MTIIDKIKAIPSKVAMKTLEMQAKNDEKKKELHEQLQILKDELKKLGERRKNKKILREKGEK